MPYFKTAVGNRDSISLDDVCYLLSIQSTKDDLGQPIQTKNPFMVFCSKVSITRAEFSNAGQLGYKPDMMLLIDSDAYGNEKALEYQEKTYNIYKTYQRPDSFIELYCEVKTGV